MKSVEADYELELSMPLEEFSLWLVWEFKIMRHIDK